MDMSHGINMNAKNVVMNIFLKNNSLLDFELLDNRISHILAKAQKKLVKL